MEKNIVVRPASDVDLGWVNQRYAEGDFKLSGPQDFIAVAEVDGVTAGIGRITAVGDGAGELGGMLVFEAFRGDGLSKKIIRFLLEHNSYQPLFCLPFANLKNLYESMGFVLIADEIVKQNKLPAPVLDKHRWCNVHYPTPVLLMQLAS